MDSNRKLSFISVFTDITFLASSMDWDSNVKWEKILSVINQLYYRQFNILVDQIPSRKRKMEIISLSRRIHDLMRYGGLSSEWKAELSLIGKIMFLVSSMDLESQPRPESEVISLIKRVICLFNTKLDSESDLELLSFIRQLVYVEPEQELTSLVRQVISLFKSMSWEQKPLLSLHPQVMKFEQSKFRLMKEVEHPQKEKCRIRSIRFYSSNGKHYFYCKDCNGEEHEEDYEKAQVEVLKHSLHPKHSLQLVFWFDRKFHTRDCYCCDESLEDIFYYCSACDFAMKIACVETQPLLSVHHLKWHEHTLSLFPRHTSLTCDACALTHSTCHFYVCPPCDFVIHQSCISLPRVIRISRHPHRISFTPSFDQRDLFCNICRKKIDNRYGGYSCYSGSCSYAAHSRCATQSNVWDGIDLEGLPEEIEEEEAEPFVRISDGIIQHFSHQQHHMRIEEDAWRDYDENKLCQSCITPIYFGNFYACMQCAFILHEKCANLSRKIYHPIHPHMLTLVGGYDNVDILKHRCSACQWTCRGGFVYQCNKEGCRHSFRLNVQCATISEPLVYQGHMHPLFLTSKPHEGRKCSVCEYHYEVTFNCIERACDFALCFRCATIPQNARYHHDEHMLTLSYGEETRKNWCEACEKSIDSKKGFYKCDEYCCVTLHITCLLGKELYMNIGSSFSSSGQTVVLLPNNQHMSRPFCSYCKKRCLRKLVFKVSGFMFCRRDCVTLYHMIYMQKSV